MAASLIQNYTDIFPDPILRNLTGLAASDGGSAPNATLGLLELDSFAAGHFYVPLGDGFFRHLFAGASFLGLYFILGATVLARRIALRQCQFFKVAHRAHGRYIVPNVFDTFILSALIFCLIDICYVFVAWRAYHVRDINAQHTIRLFEVLQWIPLYIAAWFAAVGSFYTAPGALDGPPQLRSRLAIRLHGGSRRMETLKRIAARLRIPFFLNLATIGMPVAIVAIILPLAILTQRAHEHGLQLYSHFQADVIEPLVRQMPLTIDTALAASILQRADAVRDAALDDAKWLSAAFFAWTGAASIVLAFYFPAGGILLVLIGRQVRRQRDIVRSGIGTYKQQGGTLRKDLAETPARLHRWCINCGAKLTAAHMGPCECGFVVGRGVDVVQSRSGEEVEAELARDHHAAELEADHRLLARMAAAFKGRVVKQQGTPLLRYFYLRRCLLNLTLLYLSIVAVSWSVLIGAGILGAHCVGAMTIGPEGLRRLFVITALLSNWALLVFGTLSIAAIWLRHFDPANDPNYYARAGETGWAPSTMLVFLGMRQLPMPLRRWFTSSSAKSAAKEDDAGEESPSMTHIMPPTGSRVQTQRMSSHTHSHHSLNRATRSVQRFGASLVGGPKFKHLMQEPPSGLDEDDDQQRHGVEFEMVRKSSSSALQPLDVYQVPSEPKHGSASGYPQTAPPLPSTSFGTSSWTLRRSASALTLGASDSRSGRRPSTATFPSPILGLAAASLPTRPPTAGSAPLSAQPTTFLPSPPATLSASAGTGASQARTPVRFATPFGPIECPAPDDIAAECSIGHPADAGLSRSRSMLDAAFFATAALPGLGSRSGSMRSSSHNLHLQQQQLSVGGTEGTSTRHSLGLMLSSSVAAAVGRPGSMRSVSSSSTPAATAAAAATTPPSRTVGWNDRFTALRRSTHLASSRPGTSETAPIPFPSSSLSFSPVGHSSPVHHLHSFPHLSSSPSASTSTSLPSRDSQLGSSPYPPSLLKENNAHKQPQELHRRGDSGTFLLPMSSASQQHQDSQPPHPTTSPLPAWSPRHWRSASRGSARTDSAV